MRLPDKIRQVNDLGVTFLARELKRWQNVFENGGRQMAEDQEVAVEAA